MDESALDTLRRNWGEAYDIGTNDIGQPRARRLDGLGEWIVARTVDDLSAKIVDDYTSRPVPLIPGPEK